jgi:SPW repeat
MRSWTRWQSWLNVIVGVWLFISPWVLGTTSDAATAWNAWIIGAAIFVVALIALGATASAATVAPWVNVVLGVWLFISPWVLRYTDVSDGAVNAWVFGVVTVLVAVWAQSVRRAVPPPMGGVNRLDTR